MSGSDIAQQMLDGGAPPAQVQQFVAQQMLDGGAPPAQVQQFVAQKRQQMLDGGAPKEEVEKFWGADSSGAPMPGLVPHVLAGMDALSPEEKTKVASNPYEAFLAGLQMSASVLPFRKPTTQMADKPTFAQGLSGAVGQEIGDFPAQAGGWVAGVFAGGAAGAGVGALVPGAGETGASEVAGMALGARYGGSAGAAAVPQAIREVMMDHYEHEGKAATWTDIFDRARGIAWGTAKAAIIGTVAGAAGDAVQPLLKPAGNKAVQVIGTVAGAAGDAVQPLLKPAGNKAVQVIGTQLAYATGGMAAQSALDQKLPNAQDFYILPVMLLGQHAAGELVGATKRFVASPDGEKMAANARDIYARTGITPQELLTLAQSDPAIRAELYAPRNPDGTTATPTLDRMKKPDPQPYKPYAPTVTAQTEEATRTSPKAIAPLKAPVDGEEAAPKATVSPAGLVDDKTVDIFYQLEHPGNPGWHVTDRRVEATSPAGAIGPMQIMPGTALQYGFDPAKLGDHDYNIQASKTILADLAQRYDGRLADMAVAYNAGPRRADAWIKSGRDPATLPWETQKYLMHLEALTGADYHYASSNINRQLTAQHALGPDVDPNFETDNLKVGTGKRDVNPLWTLFGNMTDERVTERLPDGSVVPAPEAISYYLHDFGEAAGFHFQVGPEGGPAPHFQQMDIQMPGQNDPITARHIYIPNTPDEMLRAYYGLGRYEILYHEVGHALDYEFNGGTRTSYIPPGALHDEMVAASKAYRPKLWAEHPDYNSRPQELIADAIAQWLTNPSARKSMPEFTAKYGEFLQPYLEMAQRALPVKVGNSWKVPGEDGHPATPGAGDTTGAGGGLAAGGGGGGGGPPGPPGDSGVSDGGGRDRLPGPKPFVLSKDMLADKILDNVAPQAKFPLIPDWMKPSKWFAGFQAQLKPARNLDSRLNITPEEFGIEDMMRQTFASKERAGYFFRYGTIDPITMEKTSDASFLRAFEAVKEDGGNLKDFWAWRLAARTVELGKRGIRSGIDPDLAAAFLKSPENAGKYDRGMQIMQEAKDGSIDYARDSGMLTRAGAESMKDLNQAHVVLRRVMDPTYNPPSPGRGFRTRMPVRKIEGSDRRIVDPMTAEIDNLSTIIAMADRNRAIGNVIGAIENRQGTTPAEGKAVVPFHLDADKTRTLRGEPLEGELFDEDGNKIPDAVKPGAAPFMAMKKASGMGLGPDDFVYFRNGKPEVWHSDDPDLSQIMRVVHSGKTDPLPEMLTRIASLDRAGITGALDFPFRAIFHGQFTSAAFSEGGQLLPYHDIVKGLMARWVDPDVYERWVRSGGAGSALVDMDRNYLAKDVEKLFGDTATWKSVLNVVAHPIDMLRDLQHQVEATARIGFMARNEEKGMDTQKAATLARKAYLDHGEGFQANWANTWARMTPFMPIGFKDIDQVVEALKTRPVGTLAKAGMVLTMPSLVTYAVNYLADQGKKPGYRYIDLPQWRKDLYWNIPINGRDFITLKKPYVGGFLFSTLPEHALEFMRHEMTGSEFHGWATNVTAQMLPPFVPTLLQPPLEQATNKIGGPIEDLTGQSRPLVPTRLAQASGWMQYNPDTSETAKALARTIGAPGFGLADASAIVIDNYMKGWLGTLPNVALRAIEQPLKPAGRAPRELADIPFVGSFFVRHPGASASLEDFYTRYDKVLAAHKDWKLAQTSQDPALIAQTSNPLAMIRLSQYVTSLSRQQAMITAINRSNMTDEEKLKYTDGLTEGLIASSNVATQFLKTLENAR